MPSRSWKRDRRPARNSLAFGKKEGEVFLGREMGSVQTYSEHTAQEIDIEVRRIVTDQYARAKKVLLENQALLNKIADSLLEYETIDAADIDVLMAGGSIARPPPVKLMATTVPGDKAARRPGLLDGITDPKPAASKA